MFAPERFGGLGEAGAKARKVALDTGEDFEATMKEVCFSFYASYTNQIEKRFITS